MEMWRFYTETTKVETDHANSRLDQEHSQDDHARSPSDGGQGTEDEKAAGAPRLVTISLHDTPVPLVCVLLFVIVVMPREFAMLRNFIVLGMVVCFVVYKCYNMYRWCGCAMEPEFGRPGPTKSSPAENNATGSAGQPAAYDSVVQIDSHPPPPSYSEVLKGRGTVAQKSQQHSTRTTK